MAIPETTSAEGLERFVGGKCLLRGRIENVPDATLIQPTDAVVTITRACICGSDLWRYKSMEPNEKGRIMGHEAVGVVEAVGSDVRAVKRGDLVVMPFAWSDGPRILMGRPTAIAQ